MGKILKLIKSEEMWVIFIIVFSVGITVNLFFNEIAQGAKLGPDKFQTFEHNFLPDFNAYLSKMTQGGKGEWVVHERFTAEPHEGSLLQIFYLILGKITIGLMGLRPDFAYHLSRFVLAALRICAAYYFILAVIPGKGKKVLRILSLALFVFSGNFPLKITNPAEFGIFIGADKYRMFFDTWSNLDPLIRLSYLPHWLAAQGILMICLGFLVKLARQANPLKLSVVIGILGALGGFILPSASIIIVPVWFLFILFFKRNLKMFSGFLVGSLIIGIPLLYISWVMQFYPWKALSLSDQGAMLKFPWVSYITALGATGIIGAIGALVFSGASLINFFRKKEVNFGTAIVVLWAGVVFLSIWFFDTFLHYDQRRFIQVGVELPLAIMTVYLLKNIKNYLLIIIFGVLLIPSVFVWYISYQSRVTFIRDRINASYPFVSYTPYVVYQPRDWMEAIFWLSKNTTVDDVVFTDYVAGNYIAAYGGNRVYVGHGGQTVDYLNKLALVRAFYTGEMTNDEAKLFLMKNYAKYVFAGPQEMEYGGGFIKYTFLKPVIKGTTTTIYRIE